MLFLASIDKFIWGENRPCVLRAEMPNFWKPEPQFLEGLGFRVWGLHGPRAGEVEFEGKLIRKTGERLATRTSQLPLGFRGWVVGFRV